MGTKIRGYTGGCGQQWRCRHDVLHHAQHNDGTFWTGHEYNRDRPKEEHISIDTSHENLAKGKMCGDGYWRQIVTLYDAIAKGCNLFNLEKVKRKYYGAFCNAVHVPIHRPHRLGIFVPAVAFGVGGGGGKVA